MLNLVEQDHSKHAHTNTLTQAPAHMKKLYTIHNPNASETDYKQGPNSGGKQQCERRKRGRSIVWKKRSVLGWV